MRSIILIGGGGHCKSVINSAESTGVMIQGILDLPEYLGHEILGYKVIGNDDDIAKYVHDSDFIITLGFITNPVLRIKLHEKVMAAHGHLAKIIANDASVHPSAQIAEGTVVLHHATVNANVTVGRGCIINTASNLEHDVVVGDYSHISTGVMINGDCNIGRRTFVGSRTVVANGVHICDDVVIGCGSVVIKDITEPGTYVGNPAVLKKRKV